VGSPRARATRRCVCALGPPQPLAPRRSHRGGRRRLVGRGLARLARGRLGRGRLRLLGLDNQLTALIDGLSPARSTFWKGLVAGVVNLSLGLAFEPVAVDAAALAGALAVGVACYGA
jgi:hypothetical protein